jgi:methionyl-tRNA formyltransferase
VGKFAIESNIRLIELNDFDDTISYDKIASLNVDLFIVVAFRILPPKYITLPKLGSINIHASLLPKYRGAAPIQWSLMNGDSFTGISIFKIEKTVDTGKIIYQEKIKINDEDNFETLSTKLSFLGSSALIKVLDMMESNNLNYIVQDNSIATTAPKIKKEMLKINWSWNAEKIKNWVRGLSPFPSMYTTLKGKKYKIFKIEVTTQKSKFSPGRIEIINLKKLIVHTFDHKISILDIQKEGKKRLLIKDFLKGSNINHGDYFT